MKITTIILLFVCVLPLQAKDPVDYVNVHIGAISHLLQPTYVTVHLPNSMVRIIPTTTPGISDAYLASKIYGFPFNCPAHRFRPVMSIMPVSGELDPQPEALASNYDHDLETATPFFYSVFLEDDDVQVEFSPTERCAYYRLHFARSVQSHLVLRSKSNAEWKIVNDRAVSGWEQFDGIKQFVYVEFDRPFAACGTISENALHQDERRTSGQNAGLFVTYEALPEGVVELKYGISYIDGEQARKNLQQEIPGWTFEDVKAAAREKWNRELGKITLSGGGEDDRITFYTALYRTFERMVDISEYGRYFSAYDRQVHQDAREFYVDDWSWDSYRAHHPLRILLDPDREMDMIQSYVRMYEQSGWMPTFPQVFGDRKCMIGHHQAAIIADAWSKGLRGFDVATAYEGLLKNAMQGTMIPWREGPSTELDDFYREKGYFPALMPGQPETVKEVDNFEKRQAVAVTLEHSYDDWCLAQLALALKNNADYDCFTRRADNYQNVYNPQSGFMSPKLADGTWVEPFDPKRSGGIGCRDYFAEISSWTYSFHVQHDVPGLIHLMGGEKQFIERLDRLFEESLFGYCRWTQHSEIPDGTGLVGQYVMGNEQGFHVPYLYVYAGAPWKTQQRVHQLRSAWFRNDLMGICGDEDGGALSAWYVFSAMGFYPVCPGAPVYIIGTPLFDHVRLNLAGGKKFVIEANGLEKYIQSATLNGAPLQRAWLTHEEIIRGGRLVLKMAARPNRTWGSIPPPGF